MKSKCVICNKFTEGRGHYSFEYLGERVILCGHHARQVMQYIKTKSDNND